MVAAGDNPERLKNEATFAKLCGVSPLDASSGKQERHRLNRSGDRQANSALWHIVFTRMVNDPRTRHYIQRRMKDGRTKKEAMISRTQRSLFVQPCSSMLVALRSICCQRTVAALVAPGGLARRVRADDYRTVHWYVPVPSAVETEISCEFPIIAGRVAVVVVV